MLSTVRYTDKLDFLTLAESVKNLKTKSFKSMLSDIKLF